MAFRAWAFWRRVQYGTGFSVILLLILYWGYASFLYSAPTCFDGRQNGDEKGRDCGGSCLLICPFEVTDPLVSWARSFRIADGQYNAVGYVENRNEVAGAPVVNYTFSLYDADGLITEQSGTTFLPPNSTYPIFEGRIATGGRVPTQTFLDLEPVDSWVPVPAGREQFAVVGRELVGADERPRLNATIENTGLTDSYDVEVVATILDSRGNALTASRTFIETFPARSQQDVVFTWPEPIAKTIRSCEVPTDVVVAIDLSGSMNNDGGTPPQPISAVLGAATEFVKRLRSNDQAALVTFASDAVINEPFASAQSVQSAISGLAIDPAEESGSTNTGDAFVRAGELFQSAQKNPDARKVMVILTDGLATAPDEEPEAYALAQAAAVKAAEVEVYAIGLGSQVNMEFVRALASDGKAYQALSSGQVDQIYRQITGAICEDGAAIIEIIPKSDSNFPRL